MRNSKVDTSELVAWGRIDKRARVSKHPWETVEFCYNEEQAKLRITELEKFDHYYEYCVEPFLELPIWISRKAI